MNTLRKIQPSMHDSLRFSAGTSIDHQGEVALIRPCHIPPYQIQPQQHSLEADKAKQTLQQGVHYKALMPNLLQLSHTNEPPAAGCTGMHQKKGRPGHAPTSCQGSCLAQAPQSVCKQCLDCGACTNAAVPQNMPCCTPNKHFECQIATARPYKLCIPHIHVVYTTAPCT